MNQSDVLLFIVHLFLFIKKAVVEVCTLPMFEHAVQRSHVSMRTHTHTHPASSPHAYK